MYMLNKRCGGQWFRHTQRSSKGRHNRTGEKANGRQTSGKLQQEAGRRDVGCVLWLLEINCSLSPTVRVEQYSSLLALAKRVLGALLCRFQNLHWVTAAKYETRWNPSALVRACTFAHKRTHARADICTHVYTFRAMCVVCRCVE